MNAIKKICVVLVDRANYGRMKPVMEVIKNDNELSMDVICAGTMPLPRFGHASEIVKSEGFNVTGEIHMEVEGSIPVSMSKSIGMGIIEFSSEFNRLTPDLVLVIGDRYEALSAVIAASYMNISIAHIQGGEVSGSIDESCRHAITKFSHLHFPSTDRSAKYIVKMGEFKETVHNVGCPSGDYILRLKNDLTSEDIYGGLGKAINPQKKFILVIFHPVTTHGDQGNEALEILTALDKLQIPTLWLWPNIDSGSDKISSSIRSFRENINTDWLYLIKNLAPDVFQKALKMTSCAVGNSSSFIRDSTFSGTPVVLVGDRQIGRECGENLISCLPNSDEIEKTIVHQLNCGRYKRSSLYGDGNASIRVLEKIKSFRPNIQKIISYPFDK